MKSSLDNIGLNTTQWSKNSEVDTTLEDQEKLLVDLMETDDLSKLSELWKRLRATQTQLQRTQLFLSPFLSRFLGKLSSENLWASALMTDIIRSGLVSASVCPWLISRVLDKQDLQLLSACLKKLKNIPESDLVSTLEELLRPGSDNTGETANRKKLIDVLLSIPYTESEMKKALHHLPFSEMMILLDHLSTSIQVGSFSENSRLTYDQVLGWLSVLLDAYFTQIVVSSDAWEKLVQLRETVGVQMEMFDEMSRIEVLLTQLQHSLKRNRKPTRFTYNVEVMTI